MEEKIEDLITYHPDTGLFKWLDPTRKRNDGWHTGAPLITGNGYIQLRIGKKRFYAHRLAWYLMTGDWPKQVIDHIDNCKTNNKFNNLRDVSRSENQHNVITLQKNNTSGYSGVGKASKTSWYARLYVDGTRQTIGYYNSPEEAHRVQVEAKMKHYKGYLPHGDYTASKSQ